MADNTDMNAANQEPGISDPLSNRDTDTGNLDRLEDTRTRKTIKLRPVASTPGVKYPEAVPPAAAAAPSGESTDTVSDPLETRHTNTGKFSKLDDTRTRKTIKLSPGGVKPGEEADAEAKTIEIPQAPAEEVETATVPVSKIAPSKPGIPTLIPKTPEPAAPVAPAPAKAPIPMAPKAPAIPKAAVPGEDRTIDLTAPGAAKTEDTDDTRTRKTIKVETAAKPSIPIPGASADAKTIEVPMPGAAPAAAQESKTIEVAAQSTASVPMDMEDTRTRKTIKITPGAAAKPVVTVHDATESVMPSAAPAKAISPASQTIKLRSDAGSAPPAPVAPQSSAKDTIKLKPGASAAPLSKPAPVTPAPAVPPSGSAAPSAATVALKPSAPASPPKMPPKPAGAPSAPGAPGTASAAPKLGGVKLGVKPPTTSAPGTPEDGEKKKGGLTLKKVENDEGPKGPPRAAKEEAELAGKGKGKKEAGDNAPSVFYTVIGALTVLLLLFSAFVSAAQYANTWERERVGTHIPVPILDDRMNVR